jgi:hypothetical protein
VVILAVSVLEVPLVMILDIITGAALVDLFELLVIALRLLKFEEFVDADVVFAADDTMLNANTTISKLYF